VGSFTLIFHGMEVACKFLSGLEINSMEINSIWKYLAGLEILWKYRNFIEIVWIEVFGKLYRNIMDILWKYYVI
jgi:hypothetical protein